MCSIVFQVSNSEWLEHIWTLRSALTSLTLALEGSILLGNGSQMTTQTKVPWKGKDFVLKTLQTPFNMINLFPFQTRSQTKPPRYSNCHFNEIPARLRTQPISRLCKLWFRQWCRSIHCALHRHSRSDKWAPGSPLRRWNIPQRTWFKWRICRSQDNHVRFQSSHSVTRLQWKLCGKVKVLSSYYTYNNIL